MTKLKTLFPLLQSNQQELILTKMEESTSGISRWRSRSQKAISNLSKQIWSWPLTTKQMILSNWRWSLWLWLRSTSQLPLCRSVHPKSGLQAPFDLSKQQLFSLEDYEPLITKTFSTSLSTWAQIHWSKSMSRRETRLHILTSQRMFSMQPLQTHWAISSKSTLS